MPKTHFPRIIHRIWVGDKPIPGRFDEWWETWVSLNPEWECRHWGNAEVESLIGLSGLSDMYEHLERPVLKADIARLVILWRHGGLYVDADFECRKGIEPIVREWERAGHRFVVTPEPYRADEMKTVSNAIAFSVPRHEILKSMITDAARRVSSALSTQHRALNPINVTGPDLWKAAVLKHPDSIYFAPYQLFMPFGGDGLEQHVKNSSRLKTDSVIPESTFAVHHFAATWHGGGA